MNISGNNLHALSARLRVRTAEGDPLGEAAVKLRMLKAKYLKAADDYNIEHLIEGQWLGPRCGQIGDQAPASDEELAQIAAKCSDPEGWKATPELVDIVGRDGSCVRTS